MKKKNLFKGFNHNFLIDDTVKESVRFPILGMSHRSDLAPVNDNDKSSVNYLNYSVQLSASRKFPFFTASNINGQLLKRASRATVWKKDERVKEYQWGTELYSAAKSDFDKGHMTRREDVQWGKTPVLAQKAADSTFFYTNAVPQHKDLNQVIWKSLEDYILNTETRKESLKVCVFTGPVLSPNDPPFITEVKGERIQIPAIFWKVVVYPKSDGKLYRVGFMMSQRKLLIDNGIVEVLPQVTAEDQRFMQFEDAETYQVNISLIEQLADLKLPEAIDSYKDIRSSKLVIKEIEYTPELKSFSAGQTPGFSIPNLVL